MRYLLKKLRKLRVGFEYRRVCCAGRLFGITSVIAYLRNPEPSVTVRLLRTFGATIGDKTTFKRGIVIDNAYEDQASTGDFSNLVVGKDCYIGTDVYFDLSNRIVIEDTAVISGRVSFITHADCNRSAFLNAVFPRKCAPVRVGRGAWLGFGCTLLAGSEVEENTLLAAGSLLSGRADSHCVYTGIPANCKRKLVNTR